MMLHKHKWLIVYNLPGDLMVRICIKPKCPTTQSHMFNYTKNAWEWIDGNFITDGLRPIYILAGNYEEFIDARHILLQREPPIGFNNIKFIGCAKDVTEMYPTVIFYGTWYKNGILEDPEITQILNHRR